MNGPPLNVERFVVPILARFVDVDVRINPGPADHGVLASRRLCKALRHLTSHEALEAGQGRLGAAVTAHSESTWWVTAHYSRASPAST